MAQPFAPTSDYTPVAQWYDSSRHLPEHLLTRCFERFERTAGFTPPRQVLDAGCGTAQLSVPLMRAGHRVVGVDVSEAMLTHARAKVEPGWHGDFVVGDVRRLDFPDGHFDAVVVSKLFQHVAQWESAVDELRRVTRPGGYLLHINEKGAFRNAVRRRFEAECDSRGYRDRYVGIRDRSQLAVYVTRIGGRRVELDVTDLSWSKDITHEEALRNLRLRLHSEFWVVPDAEYDAILGDVSAWVDTLPEGGRTTEHLTPYLTAEVFEWSG